MRFDQKPNRLKNKQYFGLTNWKGALTPHIHLLRISPLLAGKRYKSFEMTFVTAYPEKAVLEAAALQVGLEFPVDMLGQGFALLGQLVNQGGVVRFDELVE